MTQPRGLIINLEDASLDDMIGVAEVLIQVGFDQFLVDVAHPEASELLSIFSSRATFGASNLRSVEHVRQAHAWGAEFVFADVPDPDLLPVARELGLPIWLPAMTPTEITTILGAQPDGVMLYPADIVGHAMSGHLKRLGLISHVVPRGGLGAFSSGEWMKAGAPAAILDNTLLGDALYGGDLSSLRDRAGSFYAVHERALEAAEAAAAAAAAEDLGDVELENLGDAELGHAELGDAELGDAALGEDAVLSNAEPKDDVLGDAGLGQDALRGDAALGEEASERAAGLDEEVSVVESETPRSSDAAEAQAPESAS